MSVEILTPFMIIFVMAVLIVRAICWGIARFWCRPVRILPKRTPADYKLPYEDIKFLSNGVSLKGWFIPVSMTAKKPPVIVLAHGWSSNASSLLPLARVLNEAGFSLLLYDSRGHGTSSNDGPITIRKMGEDLTSAVDYLRKRSDIDQSGIGVVGSSMGGSSAILAVSTDARFKAAVTISAFASPKSITIDFLTSLHLPRWPCHTLVFKSIEKWLGTTMSDVAPENRIGCIRVPLLLIHGDADQYVSASNLEILWMRSSQVNTKYLRIYSRGHHDIIRDIGCGEAVSEFFHDHLKDSR